MADQRKTRPYYTITCTIGENKFPVDIYKLEFRNSIMAPLQEVVMWIRANAEDFVLHDLYGKKDLKLNLKFMSETTEELENIDLDLIITSIRSPFSQKQSKGTSPHGEDLFVLHNIVKQPYNILKTRVNEIFEVGSNKTPFEIVGAVLGKYIPGINTEIIPANSNPDQMWQFLVPPMSFIDHIRYVDGTDEEVSKKFGPGVGIYKGPAFYQCKWEDNTFCMWDLKNAIQSKPKDYTVFITAEGGQDEYIFKKTGKTSEYYHTHQNLNNVHRSNQDLIKNAFYNNFLAKPKKYLYSWQTFTGQ